MKRLLKSLLIKVANSQKGSALLGMLTAVTEIVAMQAGRKFRDGMNNKLAIGNIINAPKDNRIVNIANNGKIKIRFYHCSASTFNVIQTVCENFINDERFDVKIVLFGKDYTNMQKQMKQYGFDYIYDYNYDIATDKPDISVIYHLEIIYPPQLTKVRDYSKYVALVPLGIGSIWFGERTVKRMNLDWFNADMCCVGNMCYDRLIEPIGKDVIERISPAQFDLAYRKFNKPIDYPKGWEKLKGKKVFMLMTDHGLRMNLISDEVSFDLYFKQLMDYFKNHQDCALILRLHFALVRELVNTYWSLDDYQTFVEYCRNSSNIVWDETDDYLNGLAIADASLVDVNCSLIYFVLAANKPIGVPLRYDMPVAVNNPWLLDKYYKIQSNDDMYDYLEMVRLGKDPRKLQRQEAFDDYIETFDGKNGERIATKIKKRYFEKLSL